MTVRVQTNFDFVKDEEYVRKELHDRFGGQRQGGISTPSRYPLIFIFTGEAGKEHGYGYDGWRSSTTFFYTGEGQEGNMSFVRGNRAIRDHEANGKRILLFEQLPKRGSTRGKVRFVNEMRCVNHRIERRDSSGISREVIVFELEPIR